MNFLTGSYGTAPGNVNFKGFKGVNCANPTDAQDVATKAYTDTALQGGTSVAAQIYNVTSGAQFIAQNPSELDANTIINLNGNKIINVSPPTDPGDAVNKNYTDAQNAADRLYVDNKIWNINTQTTGDLNLNRLDYTTSADGTLRMGNNPILGLATSTDPTSAVTKTQLDANSAGDRAYTDTALAGVSKDRIISQDGSTHVIATNGLITVDQLLDMGNKNIQNLAPASSGLHAVNQNQLQALIPTAIRFPFGATETPVDGRVSSVQLSGTAVEGFVDINGTIRMNGSRIQNLQSALLMADATNLSDVTGLINDHTYDHIADLASGVKIYYKSTTSHGNGPSNNIVNTFGINTYLDFENTGSTVNMVDPTQPQDGVNKRYADQQDNLRYLSTTPLNLITPAGGDVNINSHKLMNVLNPTSSQDAATKNYVDNTAAAGNARSLDQISAANPTAGRVDMQSNLLFAGSKGSYIYNTQREADELVVNNITLANQFTAFKAVTKWNDFQAPNSSVNYNGQALLDTLIAPTFSGLATTNRGTVVNNANTINVFNKITSAFDANGQRFTNLANPTSAQDAMTLSYYNTNGFTQTQADARYYSKTTDNLGTILPPVTSVGFGNQKIVGLGLGTLQTDAATLQNIDNKLAVFKPTSIQTATGYASVSVDDTNGIIVKGNRASNAQQLLLIQPYTPAPTKAEIVTASLYNSTTFTSGAYTTPHYQFQNPNAATLFFNLSSKNVGGGNSVQLNMIDDTSANYGRIEYNTTGTNTSTLKLYTPNTGMFLYDNASSASNYGQFNQPMSYDNQSANLSFSGNQIPSATFTNANYFKKTTTATLNQIPIFNSVNQLTASGNIYTDNAQTTLIVPSLQTNTISLKDTATTSNFLSLNASTVITGSGYQTSYGSYGYLNGSGSVGTNPGGFTTNVPLTVKGRILVTNGGEVNVVSSKYVKDIKNNYEDIHQDILNRFMQIQFKEYTLKDQTQCTRKKIGIIADQVKPLFDITRDHQGTVPNVLKHVRAQNGIISFSNDLEYPVIDQTLVRIIKKNGDSEEIKCSIINEEVILNTLSLDEEVFVYGSEYNKLSVDKMQLFEITSAIVQQQQKQINQLFEILFSLQK